MIVDHQMFRYRINIIIIIIIVVVVVGGGMRCHNTSFHGMMWGSLLVGWWLQQCGSGSGVIGRSMVARGMITSIPLRIWHIVIFLFIIYHLIVVVFIVCILYIIIEIIWSWQYIFVYVIVVIVPTIDGMMMMALTRVPTTARTTRPSLLWELRWDGRGLFFEMLLLFLLPRHWWW